MAEAVENSDVLGALQPTASISSAALASKFLHPAWDPEKGSDWAKEKPTEQCYLRIKR